MSRPRGVTISFSREALLHDIASAAFVVADVAADSETPHTLHQTFDICEGGNLERVDRLLTVAFTDAEQALRPILHIGDAARSVDNDTASADTRRLRLRGVDRAAADRVCALVHEYLVATVLAGWLGMTLPEASKVWTARHATLSIALSATATELSALSATSTTPRTPAACTRPSSPFC